VFWQPRWFLPGTIPVAMGSFFSFGNWELSASLPFGSSQQSIPKFDAASFFVSCWGR
jgi:hypothetical protein